ncbi:MAG: hypothetical protein LBQ20_11445 [Rhodanobacter sp.]|nr:hypothetical protein [Rhodanobacter sp.]
MRRYSLDVSLDGSDRHHCHLDLVGARLEGWSIPLGENVGQPLQQPDHLRLVQ